MLPLVGSDMTMRSSRWATALVAACIIAPQLVVAAISPKVGELAQDWGRRPLLLIGFGVLPLRGALLAWTSDPYMIVAVQTLDGMSGAVLGVLVPLTLADVSRGTGRFNLAQGIVGCATGVGAALSTIGAGYLADKLGTSDRLRRTRRRGRPGFYCWRPCRKPSPRRRNQREAPSPAIWSSSWHSGGVRVTICIVNRQDWPSLENKCRSDETS